LCQHHFCLFYVCGNRRGVELLLGSQRSAKCKTADCQVETVFALVNPRASPNSETIDHKAFTLGN
jgi:hypothetical protein